MAGDGLKWGWELLFLANPDLADILGNMGFEFENFQFPMFFDSKVMALLTSTIWIFRLPEIWISRLPKSGFPDFKKINRNLEIQKFGDPKNQNITILKIQVCSAQNIGKVWISRKKSSWPYLWRSEAIFSMDQENPKNDKILTIFLGGPMGPYSPGLGPCSYPPKVGK